MVSGLRCVPVSPNEWTVWPPGRGLGSNSKAGAPGPSGAQLDSGIRAEGRTRPAWAPPAVWCRKETPPTPTPAIRWVKIAARAQALGTVMGATCWPDVPGRDRQECGAPGASAPPLPHRPRPRKDQAGAACLHRSLLSWVSESRVRKDKGGQSQTPLQALPWSLPGSPSLRLRLRMARVPTPGLQGPPLHLNLVGRARQGRANHRPLPIGEPYPHPPPATGASPSRSSAPPRCRSTSFCGWESKGKGWAGLA